MMASHSNGIHRTRSPQLRVLHSGGRQASWAMMTRQARRSSAIQHDTVRCGFLSRRSYVAPSRRSRGSAKRPRKELTYCPIYGFKPCVICAKDLTPALFCPIDSPAPHNRPILDAGGREQEVGRHDVASRQRNNVRLHHPGRFASHEGNRARAPRPEICTNASRTEIQGG